MAPGGGSRDRAALRDWYLTYPRDREFRRRQAAAVRLGLPARVFAEWSGNMAQLRLEPLPGWRHLAHEGGRRRARREGGVYHVSLFFRGDPVDEAAWARVQRRFAGGREVLRVVFGNTAMASLDTAACPVGSNPDVRALHAAGWYRNRPLHVSM